MRIVSYGGGVQSTALLVLAAQGHLGTVDAFLFANVGDDSEDPDTLRYVHATAMPFAAAHGVALHELRRHRRDGSVETLYHRLTKAGSRSLPIPVRMPDTGAPGTRSCTMDFKIRVVGKWLKANGANQATPATVCVGFSWDEAHRVGNGRLFNYELAEYPLLDRRLTRHDCAQIIGAAGLPVPPKSSCYFCPYHKPSTWAEMKRTRPALFYKSADLERLLNKRRSVLGKDPVFLTRFGMPLDQAIGAEMQPKLDFGTGPGETCDEGYCWT